jgi:hypothetical protein
MNLFRQLNQTRPQRVVEPIRHRQRLVRTKRLGIAGTLLCSSLLIATQVATAVPVGVSPIDPQTQFPAYYSDSAGLKLQPCLDGLPMCNATMDDLQAPDGEFFYNLVSGEAGPFLITLALEGAYIDAGAGQEMVFNRVRISAPKGGLTPGGQYTIVHPYGQITRTANASGTIPNNAGTTDTGCAAAPCDFSLAIGGSYTSFLTWDTFGLPPAAGGPPAGYVGDNATEHLITGSPLGQNFVEIYEGSSATGTPLWRADQFTVEGKVAAGPSLSVSPATLDFGNRTTGVPVSLTATVTSKGADPLTFDPTTPFAITGTNADQFSVAATSTCSGETSLETLATCTLDVTYVPQSAGAAATLTLNTNAGAETVSLSGQSTPLAQTSTTSVSYNSQRLFTNSGTKTVTLKNTGGAPLVFQGVSIAPNDTDNPVDFTVDPATQTCVNDAILNPGQTCRVDVVFSPQTAGARSAVLRFSNNASSSPQEVALAGTGTVAVFQSDLQSWTFPDQPSGSRSASKPIVIKNVGTDTLTISDIAVGGTNPADFDEIDSCVGLTLPINGTCTVQVAFAPTTTGTLRATLDVTDNAPVVGTVHRVALAGRGLDNTAPGVAISNLANGDTVSGTAVAVSANASDDVGVVGVQFRLDGVSLGAEDLTAPYSVTWDTTAGTNGAHNLTAVARDAAGNKTTSSVTSVNVNNVVPDTTPPTVALTGPAGGATVSGTAVTVSANASDNIGVVGVRFFDGATQVGAEDTSAPYSVTWNTTTAANGTHNLTAVARDTAGNSTTSTARSVNVNNVVADTTAPTVALTAPAAAATVSGTAVTVSANASDNIGVVGVRFFDGATQVGAEDTSAPYSVTWNTTTAANGTHNLTAVARDAAGNSTTSTARSVNVNNVPTDTAAPTVTVSPRALNATVVALTANMTATFNEAVTGVSGASFTLRRVSDNSAVPAAVTYNATTRVATLNPTADLAADNKYTATLTTAIKDVAGNAFAGMSWTFLTGPRPTVTSRSPANAATGVSKTANMTATFSENVTGINTTNFTLKNATTSAAIAAVLSYNATTRVATLNPTPTLAGNTRYTVTLSTGVKDTAGNPLAATTWTFTTGP